MKRLLLILFFLILPFFGRNSAKAAPIGNYLELLGGYTKTVSTETSTPAGFTFEAWIKPQGLAGIQKILSIGDKNQQNLHYEVGINGGSLSLNFHYSSYSQKFITAGAIPSDAWSHIAVSISSQSTKLFINGSQVFTTAGATPLLPIGENIIIGGSYLEPLTNSNSYKGEIDEVRISQGERDVANLWSTGTYNNPLTPDQATVILWHFDEARGEVVAFDSSGNNYHGSLIGADTKIHFFGVLPTPTPLTLPTIRWLRPVLPTLSLPRPSISPPPITPLPTVPLSSPRTRDVRLPRSSRSLIY